SLHDALPILRAPALGDQVGAPVEHADPVEGDRERIGEDLRHDRLVALAGRGAAGVELHASGPADDEARGLRGPGPARLDEAADADAVQPAVHEAAVVLREAGIVTRLQGAAERGAIVSAVVLAGGL